jgi:hypothetical protein
MAIVDLAYYSTVYLGQEASDCDFPALEARAEDVIGAMTRWRATEDTIADLPPFQRTLVKKAVCAQVDYFAVNGLDVIASTSNGPGFTVGKVSVSGRSGSDLVRKGAMADYIAPMALAYLEQSGLMNPQVALAPDLPLVGGWPLC